MPRGAKSIKEPHSHPDHRDMPRLSSKSFEITYVTSEDGTVRLSQCHDQRINSRSFPGSTAELGSSTSKGHRHRIFDQACTDELVQRCVATGPSL
jgi:hypothetical protein